MVKQGAVVIDVGINRVTDALKAEGVLRRRCEAMAAFREARDLVCRRCASRRFGRVQPIRRCRGAWRCHRYADGGGEGGEAAPGIKQGVTGIRGIKDG